MAYPDLPTFQTPFAFQNGRAAAVEQNSVEDVQSCVYNLCVCPQGVRDDLPTFGIPDPLFQTMPVDVTALNAAIQRWEPRAQLDASQVQTGASAVSIVELVSVIEP